MYSLAVTQAGWGSRVVSVAHIVPLPWQRREVGPPLCPPGQVGRCGVQTACYRSRRRRKVSPTYIPSPTLISLCAQSPLPFCSVAHSFSYSILHPVPSPILFCAISSLPFYSIASLPYCTISPLLFYIVSHPHSHSFPCSKAPVPPPSLRLLLHWWNLCPSPAAIRPTTLTVDEEEESARYKQH